MSTKKDKSKYQVPNLERALKIMELLSSASGGATKAEIARLLEYPPNSVFRIVSTLEEHAYLLRDEDSNKYSLSRKMLSLGYKALVETNLVEQSGDILRKLRDETRETALLGVLLEGEGVVLEQELSPEPIKFMVSPGTRFMLHTAAPGKAILAFLDDTEFEYQLSHMEFPRFTANTITSQSAFRKELAKVRENGYGVDMEEEAEGIICISAPVFDYRGLPRAAIWVTGPKFRLSVTRIPEVSKIIKEMAELLSKRLGN